MASCFKCLFSAFVFLLFASCGYYPDDGYAPSSTLRIFAAVDGWSSGDIGGLSVADAACESEARALGLSGTFKAMMVTTTRRACTTAMCSGGQSENLDWVLKPNTTYYREDGTTVIGTTNSSGIFTFPLANSISSTAVEVWTGLNSDWTTGTTCDNWTNMSVNGRVASSDLTTSDAIGKASVNCIQGFNVHHYCAEQ